MHLMKKNTVLGNSVSKEQYLNDYYNDTGFYNDDNKNESKKIKDAIGNKETIVKRNQKCESSPKTIMVNTIKLKNGKQ